MQQIKNPELKPHPRNYENEGNLIMYGYDYFINENGNQVAVSRNTGEVTEAITVTLPIGSKSYTPEQQQQYKKWQEHKLSQCLRKNASDELGNFYFLLTNNVFDDVQPQTATRLIMLFTYLHYDGSLKLTQRTSMRKSDLQEVLRLSKSATHQFWNEVKNRYLSEIDGVLFSTDNKFVFRGKMNKEHQPYQKFYINSVRNLYRKVANTKKHKQLGYIFKLLPYINIQFNIICKNPFESDLNMIEPLTIGEFCELIQYNSSNFHRLLRDYRQITFYVQNRKENFVSFIWDGITNKSDMKFYVNPHILYAGTNYEQVKMLGKFCEIN